MSTAWTSMNPRWIYNNAGAGSPPDVQALVDTAATYKAGQFMRKTTDGDIVVGTTGAASGNGADAISHYALKDLDTATGNATTEKHYGLVRPTDVWLMHYLTGCPTVAQEGDIYDMDVTDNVCTLNTGSNSHAVFSVVEPAWVNQTMEDTSSDTVGRVWACVLARSIVYPIGTATPA